MPKVNWKYIETNTKQIREKWKEAWANLDTLPSIDKATAQLVLGLLFDRTCVDLLEHFKDAPKVFPTKQSYVGRLANVKNLWWLDHATAGINGWGTLDWFSSRFVKHVLSFKTEAEAEAKAAQKAKYNAAVYARGGKWVVEWKGLAEASTHFVAFQDGTPFMLMPLEDGCWGEPKRNGDAIQIEMVNALVVHRKDQDWFYWAGRIPEEIVRAQSPMMLDKPFRGAMHMQPYTLEQVITNIKLKRLCIAALDQRLVLTRMSQHTDWRESKYDMGPLWPFDLCNSAAFENYPVTSYNFAQQLVPFGIKVPVSTVVENAPNAEDPDTEHDLWEGDDTIDSTKEIQRALVKLYGPAALPKFGIDGDLGPETVVAVHRFQLNWNRLNSQDRINVDGVPGVETCKRLQKALAMGTQFVPI